MNDCISRKALIDYANNSTIGIDANDIARFPGVDAVEVKYARLENVFDFGNGNCFGYCSNCYTELKAQHQTALRAFYIYCPHCGAKIGR